MSEDSHHHFFHRHKNEEKPVVDFKTEKKHQGHLEHCAELAATAAGAYALHEKHLAVKDPEHARMHKFKEGIATTAAVAAGGIALHYHQEKEEIKKKEEEAKKKEKREKEERKKEAKKK